VGYDDYDKGYMARLTKRGMAGVAIPLSSFLSSSRVLAKPTL
jgi:hypothetical protein